MFNSKRIERVEKNVDMLQAKLCRREFHRRGLWCFETEEDWVSIERIEAIEAALGLKWVKESKASAHHEKIKKGKK